MQEIILQVYPRGVNPIVQVSQYDKGRNLLLKLYEGSTAYNIPEGCDVLFEGQKPDETVFSYQAAYTDNLVTLSLEQQVTLVAGRVTCELRIINGDSVNIGTINFTMYVEASPVDSDDDISETEIPALIDLGQQYAERAETAAEYAEADRALADEAATLAQNVLDTVPDDYLDLLNDVDFLEDAIFYEELSPTKSTVNPSPGLGSLTLNDTYLDTRIFENKSKLVSILLMSKSETTDPNAQIFIVDSDGNVISKIFDGAITGSFSANTAIAFPVNADINPGEMLAVYSTNTRYAEVSTAGVRVGMHSGSVDVGDILSLTYLENYAISMGYEYYEYLKNSRITVLENNVSQNESDIQDAILRIDSIEDEVYEKVKSPLVYYGLNLLATSTTAQNASIDTLLVNNDTFDEKIYIERFYFVSSKSSVAGNYSIHLYDVDESNVAKYLESHNFIVTTQGEQFEITCDIELDAGHRIGIYSDCKLGYLYNTGDGMNWYALNDIHAEAEQLSTPTYSNSEHSMAIGFDYSTYSDFEVFFDLFLCCGQSNMAGRGDAADAPQIIAGAGYEYKSISDPTKLTPLAEPFGVLENDQYISNLGVGNIPTNTGSMMASFTNAYYSSTNVPIIAVAAAEGGTATADWLPGQTKMTGALLRLSKAQTWLTRMHYKIRHTYVLWCQGESDGDNDVSGDIYASNMATIINSFISAGAEKVLMVRIGNCNIAGSYDRYKYIIDIQNEIAQTNENVVMVSCDFAGMRERGLMKDSFHYFQAGYNECGTYSGVNSAFYTKNNKEPSMYDTENNSLYYSHKN